MCFSFISVVSYCFMCFSAGGCIILCSGATVWTPAVAKMLRRCRSQELWKEDHELNNLRTWFGDYTLKVIAFLLACFNNMYDFISISVILFNILLLMEEREVLGFDLVLCCEQRKVFVWSHWKAKCSKTPGKTVQPVWLNYVHCRLFVRMTLEKTLVFKDHSGSQGHCGISGGSDPLDRSAKPISRLPNQEVGETIGWARGALDFFFNVYFCYALFLVIQ